MSMPVTTIVGFVPPVTNHGSSSDSIPEMESGEQLEKAFEGVKKTHKRPCDFLVNAILIEVRKNLPEGNDLIPTAVGLYAQEKNIKVHDLKTVVEREDAKVDCVFDMLNDSNKFLGEGEKGNLTFQQNLLGKLNQCFAEWLVSEEKKKS